MKPTWRRISMDLLIALWRMPEVAADYAAEHHALILTIEGRIIAYAAVRPKATNCWARI